MTDLSHVRGDFPLLSRTVNGHQLVYFDSAATTQKPESVLAAMDGFYRHSYANVHRGAYTLSQEATDAFEAARTAVAAFIGARADELVFTRGATTSLNYVAYGWGLNHLRKGDRILLTVMEHHANLVPWQLVARYTGAELVFLPLDREYRVALDGLDDVVDERVKIVAFSGMSNVTGAFGPVAELTAAARSVGALAVMDGAQLVPHHGVDVAELGVDFLAFSAHKMLGPTSVGALWGKPELLAEMEPTEGGGEMISDVQLHTSRWAPVPHKFEAGTPPITEAIGFGAAVEYLAMIGMDEVRKHEVELTQYALTRLSEVPDLTVLGPEDVSHRGGVISFQLGDIHAHDIATILDQYGIAVRAGHHCAKPLMRHLDVAATARASFYIYNTTDEVDRLVAALYEARKVFGL